MSTLTGTTISLSDSRWRRRLRAYVLEWLDTIDPDMRLAVVSLQTWRNVTVLGAMVIVGAGLLPATRELFHLDAGSALACFTPTLVLGVTVALLERQKRLSLFAFGVLVTLGSALFQFFMWSLISLSEPPGALVMAAFPMLLAAYHGHVFRASPRYPMVAVGTGLAAVGALLVERSPTHLAIYAVVLPMAAGLSLSLGQIAQTGERSRVRSLALREALDAQLLLERARREASVSRALLKLQGAHHDAGNALSGVLFNLEMLAMEASRSPVDEERRARIGSMAVDLLSSMTHLRGLLEEARLGGELRDSALETVALRECVERVVRELRARAPGLSIELVWEASLRGLAVPVFGGVDTLHRVLTNVAVNASEGNGVLRPSRVSLAVLEDGSEDAVCIEVADDGPGFSSMLLAAPFNAYRTTKAGGMGLGLYTSERLIRAAGGRIELENRSRGPGAVVRVVLPRRTGE